MNAIAEQIVDDGTTNPMADCLRGFVTEPKQARYRQPAQTLRRSIAGYSVAVYEWPDGAWSACVNLSGEGDSAAEAMGELLASLEALTAGVRKQVIGDLA